MERLARLDARVASLPDPEAERERERIAFLHGNTYFDGGSLEDIPEKDRDPSLWETLCTFVPAQFEMVWKGELPGLEEHLEAGMYFTLVEGIDEDDVRAYLSRTSDPNTSHKP